MSKVPAAYAALMEKQQQERKIAEAQARVRAEREEAEELNLYTNLSAAFADYHNSTLSGHKVKVLFDYKKRAVLVNVDNRDWVIMTVKRIYHYCHCENACDCESSSTVDLDVVQLRKSGTHHPYFPCYEFELHNADRVARAMSCMINDFEAEFGK